MQRHWAPFQNQEINFPSLESIFLKKSMVPLKVRAANRLNCLHKEQRDRDALLKKYDVFPLFISLKIV